MGVLAALSASKEATTSFERRTLVKGATTMEKVGRAKSEDKIYLSNTEEALFNIGAWGEKHYHSCQNWRPLNQWDDNHCKTTCNLEDATVLVLWYGGPQEMKSRALIRHLKISETGEEALGVDAWYGNANNKKMMIEVLKEWALKKGIKKVADISGQNAYRNYDNSGKGGNQNKYQAESFVPVKFSQNVTSYTDLAAWQTIAAGKDKGAYTYKVFFQGLYVDW